MKQHWVLSRAHLPYKIHHYRDNRQSHRNKRRMYSPYHRLEEIHITTDGRHVAYNCLPSEWQLAMGWNHHHNLTWISRRLRRSGATRDTPEIQENSLWYQKSSRDKEKRALPQKRCRQTVPVTEVRNSMNKMSFNLKSQMLIWKKN